MNNINLLSHYPRMDKPVISYKEWVDWSSKQALNETDLYVKEILCFQNISKEFIAEDNPWKAIAFTDFLVSKSFLIEENPKIGRMVPEFSGPDIRELIVKGYRLVYRIGKNRIDVLTVFEGHRQVRKSEIFTDEE